MKILKIESNKKPYIKEIENNVIAFQKEVGGLFESIQINDYIDLIVNEYFLINNSILSLYMDSQIIFGECFFVRVDKENYTSLTDADIIEIIAKIVSSINTLFHDFKDELPQNSNHFITDLENMIIFIKKFALEYFNE